MLATDCEIAEKRAHEAAGASARGRAQPETALEQSLKAAPLAPKQGASRAKLVDGEFWQSVQPAVLLVKGLIGFSVPFISVFVAEVLLFKGMEFLSGHRLQPIGLGWIVMPILAGCAGWTLLREIDLSAAIGVKRVSVEMRRWPHQHKIALAIAMAVGWLFGVLLGFFVTVLGEPAYRRPTLGTWLFGGSYGYEFPWASLAWGIAGAIVSAAIIYAVQLLRSESSVLSDRGEQR
jgi:hypothetical protein